MLDLETVEAELVLELSLRDTSRVGLEQALVQPPPRLPTPGVQVLRPHRRIAK
jgi:hypothetical protein